MNRTARLAVVLALASLFGVAAPVFRHAQAQTLTQALNNATSTLAADHVSASGTLVLAAGEGARFGTPSVDSPVRVTVSRRPTLVNGRIEATTIVTIFNVTARSGDTLSGLTAVESTSDRNFYRNDRVEAILTAGQINALNNVVNDAADAATEAAEVALEAAAAVEGKADLAAVVQKTGSVAETITGSKTFSSPIVGTATGNVGKTGDEIVSGLKQFQEPTGSGTVSASFGRNNSGTYNSLVQFRTINNLIYQEGHARQGQGSLWLGDAGVPERQLLIGAFNFGYGLYQLGSRADAFEFAVPDNGVAVRSNYIDCRRHIFEVRMPRDDSGLMMVCGIEATPGDGTELLKLPHSGMNGPGCYIYSRDTQYNGLTVHNFDGTGVHYGQTGVITYGGRMIKAGHPVVPLTVAQWEAVPAYPINVRLLSGSDEKEADLSWGYFTDGGQNFVDYVMRRGAASGASMTWGPAPSGVPDVTKSIQVHPDGVWSIGGAVDGNRKLKVYGTGEFTGILTLPTAAPGTNTTQAATTEFVTAAFTSPTFTGFPAFTVNHPSEVRVLYKVNGTNAGLLNVDGATFLVGGQINWNLSLMSQGAVALSFGAGADATFTAAVTATSYKVGANQVVGARGAAVADATDNASAITQLNALLARMRTHGLIAP